MLAGVVKRIAAGDAELAHSHADRVRRIGLQPAFADVEHLVEHIGNMEAQRFVVGKLGARSHLLVGQPAFTGEGEFQFVTIEKSLF